jgi:hypothetical protein
VGKKSPFRVAVPLNDRGASRQLQLTMNKMLLVVDAIYSIHIYLSPPSHTHLAASVMHTLESNVEPSSSSSYMYIYIRYCMWPTLSGYGLQSLLYSPASESRRFHRFSSFLFFYFFHRELKMLRSRRIFPLSSLTALSAPSSFASSYWPIIAVRNASVGQQATLHYVGSIEM